MDRDEKSPGAKLLRAVLIAAALCIPIFMVWFLVYDRQSQSQQASASITEGWGGAQAMTGPLLVIPYRTTTTETAVENGKSVTRTRTLARELTLAPELVRLNTKVRPERRKRSIYEAVVYEAQVSGQAKFAFPPDLARHGVAITDMDLSRAELRFGLSDPRGLGANPQVRIDGQAVRLQPGAGSGGGRGFFASINGTALTARPFNIDYSYAFRGNGSLELAPQAGETHWVVRSSWPHPSFAGDFIPSQRRVSKDGFAASYRIGNLALGRTLIATSDPGAPNIANPASRESRANPYGPASAGGEAYQNAHISLIQPVDLYSQVDRATKYGFLFIGFTFAALLLFDVIGGVRVSSVEYLLTGAALVLFFVLLLAFAEVIGFAAAYVVASLAIAGLNTAYSAAILKSWRRAGVIGGLLIGLYALLYVLLSLEAFSLLIGSLLLFVALAGVMYATRQLDWSGQASEV